MTEAEWLKCRNPNRMLAHLRGQPTAAPFDLLNALLGFFRGSAARGAPARRLASPRKVRLFACACCRKIWPLLADERERRAVEVAEQFADGLVKKKVLTAARQQARAAADTPSSAWHAAWAAVWAGARQAARTCARQASLAANERGAQAKARRAQAVLAREIFGNPFRPIVPPAHWSTAVIQLAEAIYAGEDCAFALHDALLDEGHAELAVHFKTPDHPKGCWAIDVILGRQ